LKRIKRSEEGKRSKGRKKESDHEDTKGGEFGGKRSEGEAGCGRRNRGREGAERRTHSGGF